MRFGVICSMSGMMKPHRGHMTDDDRRRWVLRQAQDRDPWTVEELLGALADPAAFKQGSAMCAPCPAPCESNEVCSSAVAHGVDLFEEMGRKQAFHLIGSGADRLRLRDEVTIRLTGAERPNTFISLRENENPEKKDIACQ